MESSNNPLVICVIKNELLMIIWLKTPTQINAKNKSVRINFVSQLLKEPFKKYIKLNLDFLYKIKIIRR